MNHCFTNQLFTVQLTNQSQRLTYQGSIAHLASVGTLARYTPERLCSRTPASTVLYRTGHSVMNYSFAVVLCVSESVKDIFRLHACLQDSSLFPHLLITTWPSTTADYAASAKVRNDVVPAVFENVRNYIGKYLPAEKENPEKRRMEAESDTKNQSKRKNCVTQLTPSAVSHKLTVRSAT
ncbi:hypothetical protein J6590_063495 [Homalodisca vitripennis]|nr:hypothetical protein J6590_063495 [Homalodisca vitripennis]